MLFGQIVMRKVMTTRMGSGEFSRSWSAWRVLVLNPGMVQGKNYGKGKGFLPPRVKMEGPSPIRKQSCQYVGEHVVSCATPDISEKMYSKWISVAILAQTIRVAFRGVSCRAHQKRKQSGRESGRQTEQVRDSRLSPKPLRPPSEQALQWPSAKER